jgi:RHS repeat-associated protein
MVALNEELDEIAEEPQARCGCGAAEGAMTFPPKNQSNPRSVPYCSDSYLLDSDSSRHYARNRNYSPSLGRWINQDPAGYINGANTYQFVESDPVNAVDPTGTIAWYYWAAAGGVDILGGGPEDPLADAVDAGILGAGEAAATEDAAQLAAQQAAREAALKAAQTTARMALLAAAASNKPKAAPKAESKAGARGGNCPASGSPKQPDKKPKSRNQMQQQAARGQAPKGVDRVDNPHVPGQQPHVHYDDGTASNMDGSTHDAGNGVPNPSQAIRRWLIDNGWTPPPG